MKILYIHTRYSQKGGEDTVVESEIKLLKEKYDVEVIYFQNKTGIKGAFQFLLSIWNVFSAYKVKNKIKAFNPDVVHVHNWHFASGPLIIRAIKKAGLPIIQTIHNYRLLCPSGILFHNNELFLDSLEQSFPWKAINKKVYRNSILQTFWLSCIISFHNKIGTWNLMDRYICLTKFSEELHKKSKLKITDTKFCIKPNFTEPNSLNSQEKREKCFLFIGRLCEEKGIINLLNVIKETNFKLKIVGDGPLKEIVQKTEIKASNIEYLGQLPKEKVLKILGEVDALIFPSIWYEGMPMTIIESLSTSTPVIASNLGAMKSMITDNYDGYLFDPNDENSLVEILNKFSLLSDQEKAKMSKNAQTTFETKYTEEIQDQYFETIYTAIK